MHCVLAAAVSGSIELEVGVNEFPFYCQLLSNQSAASPRQEVRSRRHDYQRAIPGAPEIRPLTRTQHFTSNYSAISNSEREILQIIIGLIFFRIINFKREALYVTT